MSSVDPDIARPWGQPPRRLDEARSFEFAPVRAAAPSFVDGVVGDVRPMLRALHVAPDATIWRAQTMADDLDTPLASRG